MIIFFKRFPAHINLNHYVIAVVTIYAVSENAKRFNSVNFQYSGKNFIDSWEHAFNGRRILTEFYDNVVFHVIHSIPSQFKMEMEIKLYDAITKRL